MFVHSCWFPVGPAAFREPFTDADSQRDAPTGRAMFPNANFHHYYLCCCRTCWYYWSCSVSRLTHTHTHTVLLCTTAVENYQFDVKAKEVSSVMNVLVWHLSCLRCYASSTNTRLWGCRWKFARASLHTSPLVSRKASLLYAWKLLRITQHANVC